MNENTFAWGALPVERFVIENWNYSSTINPAEQRCRLIHEYLKSDANLKNPVISAKPVVATAFQIDTILRPWRNDDLRRKAQDMFTEDAPILLRTHYDSVDDSIMKEWIAQLKTLKPDAGWAIFDDAHLFNFGPDWQRIYDIMPEAAGPMSGENRRSPDWRELDYVRALFKENLETRKEREAQAWKENPFDFIQNTAACLQRLVTTTYIFIADQDAFNRGLLKLLYLDGQRNIIREARVDAGEIGIPEIIMHWDQTTELWEQSTVGEKYRVEGDLGKKLYQLTEQDLLDP